MWLKQGSFYPKTPGRQQMEQDEKIRNSMYAEKCSSRVHMLWHDTSHAAIPSPLALELQQSTQLESAAAGQLHHH